MEWSSWWEFMRLIPNALAILGIDYVLQFGPLVLATAVLKKYEMAQVIESGYVHLFALGFICVACAGLPWTETYRRPHTPEDFAFATRDLSQCLDQNLILTIADGIGLAGFAFWTFLLYGSHLTPQPAYRLLFMTTCTISCISLVFLAFLVFPDLANSIHDSMFWTAIVWEIFFCTLLAATYFATLISHKPSTKIIETRFLSTKTASFSNARITALRQKVLFPAITLTTPALWLWNLKQSHPSNIDILRALRDPFLFGQMTFAIAAWTAGFLWLQFLLGNVPATKRLALGTMLLTVMTAAIKFRPTAMIDLSNSRQLLEQIHWKSVLCGDNLAMQLLYTGYLFIVVAAVTYVVLLDRTNPGDAWVAQESRVMNNKVSSSEKNGSSVEKLERQAKTV